LCSRKVRADILIKSYDWAIEQRGKGNCIISGFHSQIEKDVFHYLLKGSQPIIISNEKRKGKASPEKRPGVTINRRDLIAVPVPDAKFLCRELSVRDVKII